jgi:hypothetical protein
MNHNRDPESETGLMSGANAGPVSVVKARYQPVVNESVGDADYVESARAGSRLLPTASPDAIEVLDPIVKPPTIRRTGVFVSTARWEGVVLERFSTYFAAEVIDLVLNEPAYVEFDLDELSKDDIPLCEPGALFYWAVGYRIAPTGQRSRSSVVTFRRRGRQSTQ